MPRRSLPILTVLWAAVVLLAASAGDSQPTAPDPVANLNRQEFLPSGAPPEDGNFWVFYGALSDVEYTIHVPPGEICGRADTTAF